MAETLLRASGILLFGRVLDDLSIDKNSYMDGKQKPRRKGANKFLQQQLLVDGQDKARFARIYGFAYDGQYYEIDPPVVMLVHGKGERPETEAGYVSGTGAKVAPGPSSAVLTGSAVPRFPFAADIRVWAYDQADFTIRMDVVAGTFEDLLVGAELAWEDENPIFSGGKVGGGKVGGGKVGGGKVGGGKVGGGKVGGGKAGGGEDGGGKVGSG